jgi:hypothetical protein
MAMAVYSIRLIVLVLNRRCILKKDKNITEVIFRRFKDGDVIALFPYDIATLDGEISSYQHIGQHSGADLGLIKETKHAKLDEVDVKALFDELTSIGYNLKVMQKVNYNHYTHELDRIRFKFA